VLLVVAALFAASGVAFAHRWDLESAEEVKAVAGSISYSRAWGFTLSTTSGERYRLLMHPMRFLDETQMTLGANDRVSVSGFKVDDEVIMVTTIGKGSKTYEIADPKELGEWGSGPHPGHRLQGMMGFRPWCGGPDQDDWNRGRGYGMDGSGQREGYGMGGSGRQK
jgi:hypothetical protein